MKISHEQWVREAAILQLRLLRAIAQGVNPGHTEFKHPDGDLVAKAFKWLCDCHEDIT